MDLSSRDNQRQRQGGRSGSPYPYNELWSSRQQSETRSRDHAPSRQPSNRDQSSLFENRYDNGYRDRDVPYSYSRQERNDRLPDNQGHDENRRSRSRIPQLARRFLEDRQRRQEQEERDRNQRQNNRPEESD
jgi:hypothetical protein